MYALLELFFLVLLLLDYCFHCCATKHCATLLARPPLLFQQCDATCFSWWAIYSCHSYTHLHSFICECLNQSELSIVKDDDDDERIIVKIVMMIIIMVVMVVFVLSPTSEQQIERKSINNNNNKYVSQTILLQRNLQINVQHNKCFNWIWQQNKKKLL